MKLPTVVAAAGMLAALSLALPTAPLAIAEPAGPRVAPHLAVDTIAWTGCPAENEIDEAVGLPRPDVLCGSVPVPLDYDQPMGRTIDVHVRRITATGPRTGVLFGNPGGPGGDARRLWYSALLDRGGTAIEQLRTDHDLVVVQPRGLEQSGNLRCAPDRPALELSQDDIDRKAVACRDTDPDLVRSLTTENVVRDHDLVRERMGLERVSFLGYSYGTALGMAYQALFPERLERLVLDSAVGPSDLWWREMSKSTASHRHEAVYYVLDWIAENDATYGLGDTSATVYRAVRDLDSAMGVDRPRFLPPATGSLGSVAGGSVRLDTVGAGSSRSDSGRGQEEQTLGYLTLIDYFSRYPQLWSDIAWSISGRVTGENPESFTPAEFLDHVDGLSGAPETELDPDQAAVHLQSSDEEVYFRILTCNEDTSADDTDAERLVGSSDSAAGFGSLEAVGSVLEEAETLAISADRCPFPPTSVPPATTANPLAAAPMVLQSDHDPSTPGLHGPQAAAATGGVLVRVKGTRHGLFGSGNDAVDAAVLHYLRTGEVAAGQYLDTPRPAPEAPPWAP